MAIVLDTHATVWFMQKSARLSPAALDAIQSTANAGDDVFVPSVSLVELVYLVEKQRIPKIALDLLLAALSTTSSDLVVAALDLSVVRAVEQVDRALVPDMPDRIIAATAIALAVPLVTRDERIRRTGIPCIW